MPLRAVSRPADGHAQHVVTLPKGSQASFSAELEAFRRDVVERALAKRFYGEHPFELTSTWVSRNINDMSEAFRFKSMLWHVDGAPPSTSKAILYLNDVNRENGCMAVMRHNRTREVLKLQPPHHLWGQNVFPNVPRLWMSLALRDGHVPECLAGPAGTLILFDVNIVHRGSRPAPGRFRDFVLWEFRRGK